MNIIIRNSEGKPIYEQISGQIRQKILSGELAPGDALPSMRLLAKELRISVITTKRAYEELERDGFLYSIVGKGSFVACPDRELLKEEQRRGIEELLAEAADRAGQYEIPLPELIEMLTALYTEK